MKNGKIARFIANSAVFFVGSVLSKVIIFFLLPIYTHYIPTADYGYYDVSVAYITVLTSVLFFDVWVSGMRFLYEREDERERRSVINSVIKVFGASSGVFILVGCLVGMIFNIKYISLIIMYGLSMNLHSLYTFIARGYKKNFDFALSGVINTAVQSIMNILLLVGMHTDFSALYIAAISGNLLQCVYLETRINLRHSIAKEYADSKMLQMVVRYSLPLCLNSVAYWLLTSFNRVVLGNVYSLDMNGIYAVGNKFGSVISLVTTCFTYAWQDLSFEHGGEREDSGSFFASACDAYMLFLSLSAAVIMQGISIAFPLLIGENYSSAYGSVPLFIIVAAVSAVSTFIGNVFYAIKDTVNIFKSMVISCVCNLLICYPLIKWMGIDGANLAVLISFAVNILVRNIILRKSIGYKNRTEVFLISAAWMAAGATVYLMKSILLSSLFVICAGGFACYIYRDKLRGIVDKAVGLLSKTGK